MSKRSPPLVPYGAWPARMGAGLAAGYVGERSVQTFLSRVGSEYPAPIIEQGRRKLWLKRDLDQAIGNTTEIRDMIEDAADVL